MDFLGAVALGVLPAEALTGLMFGLIKVLAYGAAAVTLAAVVATGLCDLLECRKLGHSGGATEVWRLMH